MIVIIHWFCNHCETFSKVVFHYNSYTMLHLVCTYTWPLTPLLQHYGEIYNCLFFPVTVCTMIVWCVNSWSDVPFSHLCCDFAHHLCCIVFRVDNMHFWYNIYVAQGRWKLLKGGVPLATIYLCGSRSFKQLRNPLKYRRNLSTSFPVIKKRFVATCYPFAVGYYHIGHGMGLIRAINPWWGPPTSISADSSTTVVSICKV